MRFCIGPIPEEFVSSSEWRAVIEPEARAFVTKATIFVGVPSFVVFSVFWFLLGFSIGGIFQGVGFVFTTMLGVVLYGVLIVVHEAIHLAFHPHQARTKNSVVGIMFKPFIFYAQYLGEWSRNRFLVVLLAPLVVLSVLPMVVVVLLGAPPMVGAFLALVSSVNALASCADIYGAALCFNQIPANARVRNNGWRSFWREA
jgi:Putative zincin peptidase